LVLLIAQFVLGMITNLFVTIPTHHPGAKDSNFFAGVGHVLVWAVSSGPSRTALAIHAVLGVLLFLDSISLVVLAAKARVRSLVVAAALGLVFVLGAGFNGASFLEYNENANSLIMALLFALATSTYVWALVITVRLSSRLPDAAPYRSEQSEVRA
jgi:hypothetical protein